MKEIVYIETTIVSYLTARPSRDGLLAAHQQLTREWWEKERLRYHCLASEEVRVEAARGEAAMIELRLRWLSQVTILPLTPEMESLAMDFLTTGALPLTMRSDAMHLAAASVARADYLLTWNCRHLANANVLKRLAKEARNRGWELPLVCTPLEFMGETLTEP